MTDVPADRHYTKDHEWALEQDGRIVVGITHFAQDQLGDIVYVGLPEPGTEVTAHEPLGELESTKSVSDVYSPVTGKVLERNAEVEQNPELVNTDPYGAGWLVTIDPSGERSGLLTADEYKAVVDEAQ